MGFEVKEYIQCKGSNFTLGRVRAVDYIVVHYTATSACARNNCIYFSRDNTGTSAHYFVDKDGSIYQSVSEADTAWHAGNWTMNTRSIGIECVSAGEDFADAQTNSLRDLVQDIMARRGIDGDHVIRHHDVTGKLCPLPYIDDGKWSWLHDFICFSQPQHEVGVRVQLYEINSTDAQRFAVEHNADGSLSFRNLACGKYIDVNGASSEPNTDIQGWSRNDSLAQKFFVEEMQSGDYQPAFVKPIVLIPATNKDLRMDVYGAALIPALASAPGQ